MHNWIHKEIGHNDTIKLENFGLNNEDYLYIGFQILVPFGLDAKQNQLIYGCLLIFRDMYNGGAPSVSLPDWQIV